MNGAGAEKLENSGGTDELSRALRWSLGAHIVLLAAFAVKSLIFPSSEPLKVVPTLRVDVVGLPDLLKKDLPQFAPPPSANQLSNQLKSASRDAREMKDSLKKLPTAPKAPKEPVEKADPDEMVLKPKAIQTKEREKKLRSAMDRIRALEKISRDVENQAPSKAKSVKAGVLIKGNAISKGTSLSGEARESAVSSYYETLRDRIASNWALPVWLLRQNFSAQVIVFIDARGHIKGYKFTRTSGNAQFDEEVKRALAESDPVPTPPDGIAASLSSNGISVSFPL